MPPAHPPEFRARAIELARERAKPLRQIAKDLGISESCLRGWSARADVDQGRREGVTTDDREPRWDSRARLASAMFEWIEWFYSPRG